jgi:hypothetical protein
VLGGGIIKVFISGFSRDIQHLHGYRFTLKFCVLLFGTINYSPPRYEIGHDLSV